MHNHTSRDILHQIHVFLSEIGMQNEEGGLTPDKSFRKTFGEKENKFQ